MASLPLASSGANQTKVQRMPLFFGLTTQPSLSNGPSCRQCLASRLTATSGIGGRAGKTFPPQTTRPLIVPQPEAVWAGGDTFAGPTTTGREGGSDACGTVDALAGSTAETR